MKSHSPCPESANPLLILRSYQTKAGAAMNKNPLFLALSLLLSGCNAAPVQQPLTDAPLAGARIGGPFTLTDQDGKRRSDTEFAGKYRLIYFGYTKCPDICTPDMQQLMSGLKRFEKAHPELADNVLPIFISVDPKRDTPAVLKEFVSAFHPNLIGLTGSEAEIALAAKAYATTYAVIPGRDGSDYRVEHMQLPYLMGPKGEPLALLPADRPDTEANEGAPDAVAAELAKWVR
jgi:protein SCO1